MQSYKPLHEQLYRPRNRGFTIPLYDLGAIAAGFYIGYAEGKGLDVSPTIEYLTKYGPTAAAAIISPLNMFLTNRFLRWTNHKMLSGIENGELELKIRDGYKKYKDFDDKSKKKILSSALESKQKAEQIIARQKYLKATTIATTKTAIETIIGYAAGRVYSQMS